MQYKVLTPAEAVTVEVQLIDTEIRIIESALGITSPDSIGYKSSNSGEDQHMELFRRFGEALRERGLERMRPEPQL